MTIWLLGCARAHLRRACVRACVRRWSAQGKEGEEKLAYALINLSHDKAFEKIGKLNISVNGNKFSNVRYNDFM